MLSLKYLFALVVIVGPEEPYCSFEAFSLETARDFRIMLFFTCLMRTFSEALVTGRLFATLGTGSRVITFYSMAGLGFINALLASCTIFEAIASKSGGHSDFRYSK